MSSCQNKIYYWLKLKEDFFEDIAIKKLRKTTAGATYTLIDLKLMLLSLKTEGKLFFEGYEDDFAEDHTGLEDVLIEKEIFVHCMKQHKKMRRSAWE